MRAVVQRVTRASVSIAGEATRSIQTGLVVLLGIGREDGSAEARWITKKISGLRIFPDEEGKMNRSLLDIRGDVLVVSQFTLYGDIRKGRRPSFTQAAPPEVANMLYESVVDLFRAEGVSNVETGTFQATMDVSLNNHGPVTLVLDTEGNL